jgi:ABC-type sulfate transport system substrate-binding protein
VSLVCTSIKEKTGNLDLKNKYFLTVNYFGHGCHFTTGYRRMTGTAVTMKVYPMDTIIELEGECNNINKYIRQELGHTITTRLVVVEYGRS